MMINEPTSLASSEEEMARQRKLSDFQKFFGPLDDGEHVLESYACALQREILAQGRLFVTNHRIAFHANIIGWVTNFSVPYGDIVSLDKRSTAVVIPNSIQVSTLHQRYFFASFLWRDQTYDLIKRHWQAFLGLRHHEVPLMLGKKMASAPSSKAMDLQHQIANLSLPPDLQDNGTGRGEEGDDVERATCLNDQFGDDVAPFLSISDEFTVRGERFEVGRPLQRLSFMGRRDRVWLERCSIVVEDQGDAGVFVGRLLCPWSGACRLVVERRTVFAQQDREVWEYAFMLSGLFGDSSAQVLVRIDVANVAGKEDVRHSKNGLGLNSRRQPKSGPRSCTIVPYSKLVPPLSVWFQKSVTHELQVWCRQLMSEAQKLLLDPIEPGEDSVHHQNSNGRPAYWDLRQLTWRERVRRLLFIATLALIIPALLSLALARFLRQPKGSITMEEMQGLTRQHEQAIKRLQDEEQLQHQRLKELIVQVRQGLKPDDLPLK
jgi:hypothetical protein